MKNHIVVLDYAGAFENRSRLTCYGPCECGATLVHQPWMDKAVWDEKVTEFKREHPFEKALSWSEYLQLEKSQ